MRPAVSDHCCLCCSLFGCVFCVGATPLHEAASHGRVYTAKTIARYLLRLDENDEPFKSLPFTKQAGGKAPSTASSSGHRAGDTASSAAPITSFFVSTTGSLSLAPVVPPSSNPLNTLDNAGHTALYYASARNHQKIVQYLIARGARDDAVPASLVAEHDGEGKPHEVINEFDDEREAQAAHDGTVFEHRMYKNGKPILEQPIVADGAWRPSNQTT